MCTIYYAHIETFLCSLEYEVFHTDISQLVVHHCLHLWFFSKKIKLWNMTWEILIVNSSWSSASIWSFHFIRGQHNCNQICQKHIYNVGGKSLLAQNWQICLHDKPKSFHSCKLIGETIIKIMIMWKTSVRFYFKFKNCSKLSFWVEFSNLQLEKNIKFRPRNL
jgi:hypothetical protein